MKKTMSDEAARALIVRIRQRCAGINGHHDHFNRPNTVCELVEATLVGVGYDPGWVNGPFSRMLRAASERHRDAQPRKGVKA